MEDPGPDFHQKLGISLNIEYRPKDKPIYKGTYLPKSIVYFKKPQDILLHTILKHNFVNTAVR